MRRASAIAMLCLLVLAGCDRSPSRMYQQMLLKDVRADRPGENTEFSFTNFWSFEMRQEAIALRFERARAACVNNKALDCKLVSASIERAPSATDSASATLTVLLPHAHIGGFQKSVLAPVSGEAPGDVKLQSSSTRAENVDGERAGADHKVLQLTSYRDRLLTLSKRSNLSVEDIIRLEAEISRVQGELDDASKDKVDADTRVARETVNISLAERPAGAIANVLNQAADNFVQSVASALDFLIRVIPWLPIIAAGVALLTWLVRLLWRRKQKRM